MMYAADVMHADADAECCSRRVLVKDVMLQM
jgi:hypothetical protein